MNDRIQIDPTVLRAVADQHDEVAERIATAQSAGTEISAAVASYGPIMHRVKAAAADLLNDRDAALGAHAATHRSAADVLRREAANFTSADELNAERLRL
jgi:Excreted virulence factor EspC, type VII ESX diderm